jgi:hypothetical protein
LAKQLDDEQQLYRQLLEQFNREGEEKSKSLLQLRATQNGLFDKDKQIQNLVI